MPGAAGVAESRSADTVHTARSGARRSRRPGSTCARVANSAGGALPGVLLVTWTIYLRRAPMIAGVLSEATPPALADVRKVRTAMLASSVVSLLQASMLLAVAFLSVMFLGLLLP